MARKIKSSTGLSKKQLIEEINKNYSYVKNKYYRTFNLPKKTGRDLPNPSDEIVKTVSRLGDEFGFYKRGKHAGEVKKLNRGYSVDQLTQIYKDIEYLQKGLTEKKKTFEGHRKYNLSDKQFNNLVDTFAGMDDELFNIYDSTTVVHYEETTGYKIDGARMVDMMESAMELARKSGKPTKEEAKNILYDLITSELQK